jgi:succinate dehydrogenase / fumarate reductase flavoprotein subunit
MEDHAGVFRTEEIMSEGFHKLCELRGRLADARLTDHSKVFNTARIEALELENLVDVGLSIAVSALHRRESRGAHSRPDYPKRDDVNWMKHSLYFKEGDHMDYKPVRTKPLTVESFPPKERVY